MGEFLLVLVNAESKLFQIELGAKIHLFKSGKHMRLLKTIQNLPRRDSTAAIV